MAQQDHPQWLIKRLERLPDQTDATYEKKALQVRNLSDLPREAEQDSELQEAIPGMEQQAIKDLVWSSQLALPTDQLRDIADDQTLEPDVRFAAYFTWQAQLWRRYDYKEFRRNVRHYEAAFSGLPMFDHQQAMALLSRSDLPSLQAALRYAKDAVANLSSSPGVLNLLAEVVADLGENYRDNIDNDNISTALESINKAIDINRRYGKYYANRARLLALEDRYDEAARDIRTAMEVEPSSDSPIYALRLSRYEFIRARIEDRRQQHEWRYKQEEIRREWLNEQQEVRDEVRQTRSETMLMLGLLAAVVGFIVTSFDIAKAYEPLQAGAMIGILAGSLLIVFTGFGELVRFSLTLKARTWSTLAAGLLLLGGSGFLLWWLSGG